MTRIFYLETRLVPARHNYAREPEHTLNAEKELSQRKQSTS